MTFVFDLLAFVLGLYLIVLIGRVVFDWVQVFARDWRPRGVMLVLAEAIYTLTDPPLTLGQVRLDLAFIVLFLAVSFLAQFLRYLSF